MEEKLAKLQAGSRIGGKGTPRRKVKKAPKTSSVAEQKVMATLKKFNMQPSQDIEEVNMFRDDGKVINITRPRVQVSIPSQTTAIYGNAKTKSIAEMLPDALTQVGTSDRELLQVVIKELEKVAPKTDKGKESAEGDEEIPNLVEGETFENDVE
ncbi:hypothetical protein CANCADRAFT_25099 [Tortispora caseinolytica NRRL Y-17796]|uniref:Nascent polypeptide-associated complex subunit beta n=1 Tax=Tortispora caseinolytica NRRL Y-17796 TaxID=767744 RepID=A0A1E4TG37_9ASCO|nr:hypothetical protein CANCADRAFT_25099 [Tortispora caseinolytica NRRL Y-17796]